MTYAFEIGAVDGCRVLQTQRLYSSRLTTRPQTGLPISVINSFRDKFVVVRAAPDERVFRNCEKSSLRETGRVQGQPEIDSIKQTMEGGFHDQYGMQPKQNQGIAVEDYH